MPIDSLKARPFFPTGTRKRRIAVTVLALASAGAMPALAAAAAVFAITDVDVIDAAHGRNIGPRTVTITAGRIVSVGDSSAVRVPDTATRIDGHGRYLVPGLVDMHVHLFNNATGRPPNDWAFALFVANGVTGVREMAARPEQIAQVARWRDAVEHEELVAPRVLAAGVVVREQSEDGVRDQVRAAQRAGADFIKVFSEMPAPQWHAIIDEARRAGIDVDGHVPATVTFTEAAEAGQGTAEHLLQAYEACSAIESRVMRERSGLRGAQAVELAGRQEREVLAAFDAATCARVARTVAATRIVQVPTLVLSRKEVEGHGPAYTEDARWPLLRTDEQARWRHYLDAAPSEDAGLAQQRWARSCSIVRVLHTAGAPILAGTDTPMPLDYPGWSLHDEIELLAGCGLSDAEALRAATWDPIRFLKLTAAAGSIEPGKRADLVLLDADPLADVRNLRRIRAVVLAGRVLQRNDLERLGARH